MTTNTQVVGKALYLEMRNGINTTQIIITPEGRNVSGKYVPMTCYRRKIHPATPRKTWKQVTSGEMYPIPTPQMPEDFALTTVRDRLNFTDSLFNQLISQGWTLYKTPIAIESTVEDLDDVRMGKTPYKILGRIARCRRTLNFGDSLFATVS
jgi:hypothetical protein